MPAPTASLLRTMRSVRNGPQTPTWWPLMVAVLVFAVFVMSVWGTLSDSEPEIVATNPTSSAPLSPESPAEPEDSVPAVTSVKGMDDKPVEVPTAALEAARVAYRGLSSPAIAKDVVMQAGETFPAPAAQTRGRVVDSIRVSDVSDERVIFSARYDVDGPGPTQASWTSWTLLLVDGQWLVTLL